VTRQPEAASYGKDDSDFNRRPDFLQGTRWDLDLLTPTTYAPC
jgi:hypothetical protein